MIKPIGLFAIASLIWLNTHAQSGAIYYKPDTTIKVFGLSGDEKTLAGSGGFNSAQFAVADLNHDGRKDLVTFEKSSGQVKTFINYGTAGNPDYRYRPQYVANFPEVREFLKLEDYNCDGIPDLIHRGMAGFSVSKGYYDANNTLAFSFYKELYYHQQLNGWVNAYSEPNDIPAVADVDNDGDLDFFSYDITGGKMDWYRNLRVEDTLSCDSIRLKREDGCWGKFYQGFLRTHSLGVTCAPVSVMIEQEQNQNAETDDNGSNSKTTHTGNTLCFADIDGDGDYDYMDGNVSYPDVQLLKNGRADYSYPRDSMIAQDSIWDANGVALNMVQWPAIFWLDYDDDGDKDLLFTPHADGASENYKTIIWYKNTGNDAAPDYVYQSDTLLVSETIDMGSFSHPAFYDYDKDGKPDLFVGADGFYTAGTLKGQMAYYKNTSTVGNPSFELQTLNFASIDTLQMEGASPAFGDLDNDGKDDMVIGHGNGSVSFYKNMAAMGAVQPQWELDKLVIIDDAGHNIDSGNAASPFIYDMNADGKKDLIIGTKAGWLYYYSNIATVPGTLKLQYETGKLGLARADKLNLLSGYSAPYIGRIDTSGTDYMLLGSNSGTLYLYTGFQAGNVSAPYTRIDSVYSGINSTLSYYSGYRSTPAIADIDGDGKYEMVLGNVLGGITLYHNNAVLSIDEHTSTGVKFSSVYPNPAIDKLYINWIGQSSQDKTVIINLYSATGALVYQTQQAATKGNHVISVNVTNGVYFCKISMDAKMEVHRVIVTR